ncbi:hypothetical protein Tco_1462942 [Tanacetum coccineum]
MKLTHLSFADELLVLCHGDENSIKVIKDSLLEFSKTYRLLPNMDKSVIFFGSVKYNVKQRILDVLQLIASILSAMQTYWASVVKIPKSVVKDINGSLGIRQLEEWNDVLLAKHVWRILSNKESLWVKCVNVVKLKRRSFWEIREKRDYSCTWKALLELRNKVRPYIVHTVGNGRTVSIWNDKWCNVGHLKQFITNRMLFDARINEDCSIVDMIDMDHGIGT